MSERNGSPTTMPPWRAYVAMPGYGHMTAGASRGFWRASAHPARLTWQYREGSLLASNFNALWCTALNMQRDAEHGVPLDYFAMQHADIEPEEYWLDKLIGEMESHGLDVLGVVAPIKDNKGLTSIALHEDGDNWKPKCRLSMTEVHRLPATFTSRDVGAPVLINTGLWVCRFDPAWNDQVHFTVNDRIVKVPDGRYMAQVEPEDWFISRLFHELDLKVGVTRKVHLLHRGETQYPNSHPWGKHAYDQDYIDASLVPEAAYEFPHDVDGWLSVEEGEALRELARGKRVLEIGSYCGRSTICIAQTAEAVMAIDPFDGSGTPKPRDTKDEFLANLGRYGVAERVHHAWELHDFKLPEYDLAFIDGKHDVDSVREDARRAMNRLAPGGLLAFHDYRDWPGQFDGRWDEGVTKAVNVLLNDGAEIVARHQSLAVVRPPAMRLARKQEQALVEV